MQPIPCFTSRSGTKGEKQIIVYITNIRITSLNNSVFIFDLSLKGTTFPTMIVDATIYDAIKKICHISTLSKTTIAMAIMSLLKMKNTGCKRTILDPLKFNSWYTSPYLAIIFGSLSLLKCFVRYLVRIRGSTKIPMRKIRHAIECTETPKFSKLIKQKFIRQHTDNSE